MAQGVFNPDHLSSPKRPPALLETKLESPNRGSHADTRTLGKSKDPQLPKLKTANPKVKTALDKSRLSDLKKLLKFAQNKLPRTTSLFAAVAKMNPSTRALTLDLFATDIALGAKTKPDAIEVNGKIVPASI
tara:strand:- start:4880 stop:5275 length:396 start_codon:yes stop_codon:yes gene_type:complete